MNAAKYIRYILTIATALLFFSACKDDKNESQPTDFILRVDESVSIKLPNSTSYTITTNNSAISYELSGKILTVTAIKEELAPGIKLISFTRYILSASSPCKRTGNVFSA